MALILRSQLSDLNFGKENKCLQRSQSPPHEIIPNDIENFKMKTSLSIAALLFGVEQLVLGKRYLLQTVIGTNFFPDTYWENWC